MLRFIAVGMLLIWATDSVASEAALRNCRTIADSAQRLACYDGINLPPQGASNGSAAPVPPSARGAQSGNSVQGATSASTASAPRPQAPTPAAPAAGDRAEFGLPARPTAPNIERIESRVKGRLVNWQQGTRFRLENGQVWQVTDDSRGWCECDNPRVIVSRGAFGTYFLEIEGKGNAPRVRRIE
jgi:hypothetical protein